MDRSEIDHPQLDPKPFGDLKQQPNFEDMIRLWNVIPRQEKEELARNLSIPSIGELEE